MKTLTVKWLQKKQACSNGIKWLKEKFGKKADVSKVKSALVKNKKWAWLEWLFYEGKLDGEYKSFYENGKLLEHCFYKGGKLNGEYKWFWANGKLEEHCFYKDGELDGEYKSFRDNGKLEEHCFYKDGELIKEVK